jgi:hypothetical protein
MDTTLAFPRWFCFALDIDASCGDANAQPTQIELVINLKIAKAIGLTMPESFLVHRDAISETGAMSPSSKKQGTKSRDAGHYDGAASSMVISRLRGHPQGAKCASTTAAAGPVSLRLLHSEPELDMVCHCEIIELWTVYL